MNAQAYIPEAEFRVIGPPGCGKTTWLGREVERAVERSRRVLITSQTRAAAAEITSRSLPIPEENLGTLHSHCFRTLGNPELTLSHIDDWNQEYPLLALSGGEHRRGETKRQMEGEIPETSGMTQGDLMMAEYGINRSKQTRDYENDVRDFAEKWEEWKKYNALMDFHDLIEICLREVDTAPGNPDVIFVDEAQDLDVTQMSLIRKWGEKAGFLVVVGDPDQCIYDWRGASPNAFITPPVPESQRRILSQSYRVPVKVHRVAVEWISQVQGRQPTEYFPREHEGEVTHSEATWEEPAMALDKVEKYISQGKTVMILTTCAYMLEPIIEGLRKRALPFHNPYRRNNGAWNPLAFRRNATSSADRILAFLAMSRRGMWTATQVRQWSDALDLRGHLSRGGRKEIKALMNDDDGGVGWEKMEPLFTQELIEAGLSGNLDWFSEHLSNKRRDGAQYPISIARKLGPESLEEPPRTVTGTIHCSPGDELVFTATGWVRMEDLKPGWHRLAGHRRNNNRMTWGGTNNPSTDGFDFQKSERHYRGKLVVLETERSRTRVTPNHRLPVLMNDNFYEKWCCYLMRKGDWWRIGYCVTGHRPYRSGGISGRLATEQADDAWLLSVHETREEATVAEAVWQTRYGIPGLTFRSTKDRVLTNEQLAEIHESTKEIVAERVEKLFHDTLLQKDQPLHHRAPQGGEGHKNKASGNTFTTAAGNLTPLSGYAQILVPKREFIERQKSIENTIPEHLTANIQTEEFEGTVYGLDLPPYHHYVSGGAVVHNSVKGGEADVVFLFPDLSMAGSREWDNRDTRPSILRLFYVGMTRARETLVLCSPSHSSRGSVLP